MLCAFNSTILCRCLDNEQIIKKCNLGAGIVDILKNRLDTMETKTMKYREAEKAGNSMRVE